MTDAPAPLTPPDSDLRDFPRMMIDITRLRQSSFDATPNDAAWRAGLNLWMSGFHAVPAASLDNDEASLCKASGLGRDIKTWRKVKDIAMRGWVLCSDGRWYHETVAEFALEAWLEKLAHRLSSGSGNAKRWGIAFDQAPIKEAIANASALLGTLNPASKAIPKASRNISRVDPGGTEKASRNDPEIIPSGSQYEGTEKGQGQGNKIPIANAIGRDGAELDLGDAPAWWPKRDRYGRVQGEITEKLVFDVAKVVLGKSAGGQVTRMRKAYRGDMRAVVDFLLQAQEKSAPAEWFAGVLKNAERDQHIEPKHSIYPAETHHV